ncbi:hypothetical protein WKW77_12200 [Variovorax ureilyticus]|uniref:Uncharacterized protein n=1 Tax=Variovorax ureilyticus TaxID=1836198 RepID=A0ABU8VDU4_9BURK
MRNTLIRAVGATRNYLAARPLLQGFIVIGLGDLASRAVLGAMNLA